MRYLLHQQIHLPATDSIGIRRTTQINKSSHHQIDKPCPLKTPD
jgi:hypothetical protein